MYPSASSSGSTIEFTTGNSFMANERAFMKNGSIVRSGIYYFNSLRNLINYVASISSEKVNVGIERDCVIVFVIAFWMPVIFLTSSSVVTPDRGG
jgi:hypothetical protein